MAYWLEANRWMHITIGFVGLAAFWVPIVTQKGGLVHRQFGKIFRYSGVVVVVTAFLAVTLYFVQLTSAGQGPTEAPEDWAFLLFLGYLALATGSMLSHGMAVLKHKRDLRTLATPYRRMMAWLLIFSSVFLIGWALYFRPDNMILLLVLSPLGLTGGYDMLKLFKRPPEDPKLWLYEHLGAMLGAGIAFHTAFAVFGFNQLFNFPMTGVLAVLPWILPTAIGVPASMLWVRHYKKGGKISTL